MLRLIGMGQNHCSDWLFVTIAVIGCLDVSFAVIGCLSVPIAGIGYLTSSSQIDCLA